MLRFVARRGQPRSLRTAPVVARDVLSEARLEVLPGRGPLLALVALVGLVLAAAPLAASQSSADLLAERVEGKADAAQEDPASYASNQTSNESLVTEGRWTVAWTCYTLEETEASAGADLPDPDQCADAEDVLGVQDRDEEEADVAPVADVEPLAEEPLEEATDLAADGIVAVGEVVEDPGNAPNVLLDYAGRVVGFVGNVAEATAEGVVLAVTALVGAVVATVGFVAGGLVAIGGAIADGILWAANGILSLIVGGFELTIAGIVGLAEGIVSVATMLAGLVADGVMAVGDLLVAAATGLVDLAAGAVEAAADAVTGTVEALGSAVASLWDGLTGGGGGPGDVDPARTVDETGKTTGELVEGLLDKVPL